MEFQSLAAFCDSDLLRPNMKLNFKKKPKALLFCILVLNWNNESYQRNKECMFAPSEDIHPVTTGLLAAG